METLHTKLYDKYTQLKTRNESEIDEFNRDQEQKFVNCVTAAEELIEHLREQVDQLKAEIQESKEEVTTIRSAKEAQYVEYQKRIVEETKKTKELSEEVEKLQNMQRMGLYCSNKDRTYVNQQTDSPGGIQLRSGTQIRLGKYIQDSSRKKHRLTVTSSQTDQARVISPAGNQPIDSLVTESQNTQQEPYCMRKTSNSAASCMFHNFSECLFGMKFSPVIGAEGSTLSAVHQSSRYSFSLLWYYKEDGDEQEELLYTLISLGSLERVAPWWMKEPISFSTQMCPLFFKRISQVIGIC